MSYTKKIIAKIVKMTIITTYSLLPFSMAFNDMIIICFVVNVSIITYRLNLDVRLEKLGGGRIAYVILLFIF